MDPNFYVNYIDKLLFHNFQDLIFNSEDIPQVSSKFTEHDRQKFIDSFDSGYLGVHTAIMNSFLFPVSTTINGEDHCIVQSCTDNNGGPVYSPCIWNISRRFNLWRIIGAPYNGNHFGSGLQLMSPDLQKELVDLSQISPERGGDISISLMMKYLDIHHKRDVHKLSTINLDTATVRNVLEKGRLAAPSHSNDVDKILRDKNNDIIGEGGSIAYFDHAQWNSYVSRKTSAVFTGQFTITLEDFEKYLDMIAFIPYDPALNFNIDEIDGLGIFPTFDKKKQDFILEPIIAYKVKENADSQDIRILSEYALRNASSADLGSGTALTVMSDHFERNFDVQKVIPMYQPGQIRNWLTLVRAISPDPSNTSIIFKIPESVVLPFHLVAYYVDQEVSMPIAFSDMMSLLAMYHVSMSYDTQQNLLTVKA
jgi:hypothetical protein